MGRVLAAAAGDFEHQPARRQQALQLRQDRVAIAFGGRAVAAGIGAHRAIVGFGRFEARTAAPYRRPTQELEDGIASGRVAILGLPGATPIEGGLPIVVGRKMIGAIGVSGVTSAQDGRVAKAGSEALK